MSSSLPLLLSSPPLLSSSPPTKPTASEAIVASIRDTVEVIDGAIEAIDIAAIDVHLLSSIYIVEFSYFVGSVCAFDVVRVVEDLLSTSIFRIADDCVNSYHTATSMFSINEKISSFKILLTM